MQELGPFGVKNDGKTLYRNNYAWNNGKHQLLPSQHVSNKPLKINYPREEKLLEELIRCAFSVN